ncbi:ester cyclase [Arthrobacter sp. MMS18-M83]|uniref:ester cyclase n=1 Tax=Arthrobacter sp. MMS18-M83 TaxID=2996261 RepID=UPI00227A8917|nr:ester cyclase [Arthrobacter sp. MMS18-M83]WAH99321.1 ester cyclase [Arthrobacter sp. MMS18-M83]
MLIEEVRQLDERGMAAWDQHNADDFADMFADDFTLSDVSLPDALHSTDQVRQYMETWFTAFPDMHVRSINRVVTEDAVAAEVEFTGTNTGPLVVGGMEVPATGKSVKGTGTYFVSVRDGKITSFSAHPDVAGMMVQLGMMPEA